MGGFVLFWHKGLGFCPRGVLSQRGFVLEGFCPEGFCPRGFCPRGVLSYTPHIGLPVCRGHGCFPDYMMLVLVLHVSLPIAFCRGRMASYVSQ